MNECQRLLGYSIESDSRSDGSDSCKGESPRGILRLAEGHRGKVDDQQRNERVLDGKEQVFSIGRKGKLVSVGVRRCDGI